MRKETNAKKNSTFGLTPSSPWRIRFVRPLSNYRLNIQFMDGLEGFVDLSKLITDENAGVFATLKDEELFNSVYLDYGAVMWPGGLDLAPDAMYDGIKKTGNWSL